MNILIPTLLSLLHAAPVAAPEPGACRPDVARHRSLVVRLLATEDHQETRAEHGLAGVDPATLRVLHDSQDAAICRQLDSIVGPHPYGTPTYYTAGGFYFVAVQVPERPGAVQLGFGTVAVLNPDFTVRAVLGI